MTSHAHARPSDDGGASSFRSLAIPYMSITASAGEDAEADPPRVAKRVILPLNSSIYSVYLRNHLQGLLGLPGCQDALLGRTSSPPPSYIEDTAAATTPIDLEWRKMCNEKDRRTEDDHDREDRGSLLSSEDTTDNEDAENASRPRSHGSNLGGGANRPGGSSGSDAKEEEEEALLQHSNQPHPPQQPPRATDFTRTDLFTPPGAAMSQPAPAAAACPPGSAPKGGIRLHWRRHVETEASLLHKGFWFSNRHLLDMDEDEMAGREPTDTEEDDDLAAEMRDAARQVNAPPVYRLYDLPTLGASAITRTLRRSRQRRRDRDERRLPLSNESYPHRPLSPHTVMFPDSLEAAQESEALHGQTTLYRSDYLPVACPAAAACGASPTRDEAAAYSVHASNSIANMPSFTFAPLRHAVVAQLADYMVRRSVLGPHCEPDLNVCRDLGNPETTPSDQLETYMEGREILASASFLQL